MPSQPESAGDSAPDAQSVAALLEQFRPRLERFVAVRLDPRLRRRIDVDDVLQEAFHAVVRRLHEYPSTGLRSFYLWVRLITGQKLADLHRQHLGAGRRDVGREVAAGEIPPASSITLASAFADPHPSPSKAGALQEALETVQAALERLDELDREVLALRYFERLSNDETAAVLGLTPSGAKKRHAGALARLRRELPRGEDMPTP